MKKKPTIILTAFFCLLNLNVISSEPDTWKMYFENNSVKIEYTYENCDFSSTAKQEVIIFRISNLSNKEITLNYETQIWHNNKKIDTSKNLDEFLKTVKLKENETIITNCENQWKEHTIFSGFVDNETNEKYISLTKFELTNINTENE